MSRLLSILAFLLIASGPVAPLSAQDAEPNPADEPYTATDAFDTTLTFDEPVTRIVCIWAGCSETLADLGMLPVASPLAPELARYELYFGEDAEQVNRLADFRSVEEVAQYEPQLIVVDERGPELAAAMGAVAPVYVATFDETIDAFFKNTRDLGALTGKDAEALAAIERYQNVLSTIVDRAPEDAGDYQIALMFGAFPDVYFMAVQGTSFCKLIAEVEIGACAIAAPASFDLPYGEIDPETVLASDPDAIFYMVGPGQSGPEARTDPVWPQLTAVREGRVFIDESVGFHCCGLRGPQYALELYAHSAFPEAGFLDPGPAETYDPFRPVNLSSDDATPQA